MQAISKIAGASLEPLAVATLCQVRPNPPPLPLTACGCAYDGRRSECTRRVVTPPASLPCPLSHTHIQMAENLVVGAPCGIMDQCASVLGRQNEARRDEQRTNPALPPPLRSRSHQTSPPLVAMQQLQRVAVARVPSFIPAEGWPSRPFLRSSSRCCAGPRHRRAASASRQTRLFGASTAG